MKISSINQVFSSKEMVRRASDLANQLSQKGYIVLSFMGREIYIRINFTIRLI